MGDRPRVLIVDDHLVVREGLRLILEADERVEVVGEAGDGAEALRQVERLAPAVVLMDLRMPGMDGLEALEALRSSAPGVAVVVLTTFNEEDLMARAVRAGARGYLLKDSGREAILNTVLAASRGEALFGPEVLAKVLQREATARPTRAGLKVFLTGRELEVLRAVARGARNKEIADQLGITERTVKAHLAGVFNKLGVDSRAAAVSAGVHHGLLRSADLEG